MASRMIGRATCPECGFGAAHVKESEKCLYRYCPECGSQHYAKSQRQRADLMAKTRQDAGATATGSQPAPAAATATESGATATATTEQAHAPAATAPAPRRGLFS